MIEIWSAIRIRLQVFMFVILIHIVQFKVQDLIRAKMTNLEFNVAAEVDPWVDM